ncbi:GM16527 [Drosophila sechellia]|uniref:GM16527 n=1 Tax=Drosophila sechellia TaxID=7238 RepID=B4II17_DROSE|nr:GM16527 [Drosophila sechellia]
MDSVVQFITPTNESSKIVGEPQTETYGIVNAIHSLTTTYKPFYPLPSYDDDAVQNVSNLLTPPPVQHKPLKKTPLPSLSQLQQQLNLGSASSAPQLSPDQILSMDQIVQSLTQDLSTSDNGDKGSGASPVKYDSAETKLEIEALANKKKVAVVPSTTTSTTTTSSSPVTTIATKPIKLSTSHKPLTSHYGGSTLATMLSEEDEDITEFTESSVVQQQPADTTISSLESENEDQTPVVVITARPQYFTVTRVPEPLQHIKNDHRQEETETTELPGLTQFLVTTQMSQVDEVDESTDKSVVESDNDNVSEASQSYPTDLEVKKEVAAAIATTEQTTRLPVAETSTVAEMDSTEVTPLIADLVQQLNMEMLKPTDQISMANFQTQAATVASTLVDGSNTLVSDVPLNSNETKDELEFLISDVIQQITQGDQNKLPPNAQPADDSNRLTSFAQLNTSFLLQPNIEKTDVNPIEQTHGTTTAGPFKKESSYPEALPESPTHLETSTHRIPILSLSQIYAQQQQDEDEEQQVFANERIEVQPTLETVGQETVATTEELYTEAPSVETTDVDSVEYSTPTEPQPQDPTQQTTSSEEGSGSEETTNTYSTIPESNTNRENEEELPQLFKNDTMEQKLTPNIDIQEKATEPEPSTSQEPGPTTQLPVVEEITLPTNIYQDAQEEEQSSTTEKHVYLEPQPQEAQIVAEVTDTNAAQLQPEYQYPPSGEREEDKSPVTQIPGDMSLASSDSDMSLSSEQVTEKIELSTVKSQQLNDESMEEISDELTATISEEQDAESAEPVTSAQEIQPDNEDPYVKLGETTATVVRPLNPSSEGVGEDKGATESDEDNYKVKLPFTNYGNLPVDQADEEDEDDQAAYHIPPMLA